MGPEAESSSTTARRTGARRWASWSRASPASAARPAMNRIRSPALRRASVSWTTAPSFSSARSRLPAPLPQAASKVSCSARPPAARSASRTARAAGDSPSSETGSVSCQISRRRNHSPAGSSVLAASNTVQKYRPRSHSARAMPSASSTGSGSSTAVRGLRPGIFSPSPRARISPSLVRLPRPKGTVTRAPGRAASSHGSGTR